MKKTTATIVMIVMVALGAAFCRLYPLLVGMEDPGTALPVQILVFFASMGPGCFLMIFGVLIFYVTVFRTKETGRTEHDQAGSAKGAGHRSEKGESEKGDD